MCRTKFYNSGFVPIFYLFIHLSTHHDGTTEEALLQGEDDGEGYKWKVLRGGDGAIDVFYGRGSASKLQLRKKESGRLAQQEAHQNLPPRTHYCENSSIRLHKARNK